MIVLSFVQAVPILQALETRETTVTTSLDLNRTQTELSLTAEGVILPDGQTLSQAQLQEIIDNELACYHVADGQIEKIQFFSEQLNRFYSLMPTEGAPTMLISGIPMHRIKGTDPHQDTLSKIQGLLLLPYYSISCCQFTSVP
ncbi:MAG: hypothetical protein P8183_16430 [Anaerolineae bacterium]